MGKTPPYQGIVQPTCSAGLYEEVVTARPVLGNSTDLKGQFQGYGLAFYLQYLAHWPEYFQVIESPTGQIMGYIMGKAEGNMQQEEWHGHVTAVTVAPEYRRLGIAAKLMSILEEISENEDVWMPYGSLSSQPGASNVTQAALRLTTL
ncbi:N-alpha-acetyltransferase 20 [Acropora cervicornis]|uniref:N-alpha-acetyltransferase 20 n=1 Tax=Acropora cervicornis TaxID=6130 RepID=A0AAD9UVS4_ACRCE|nr:N-alpha-acetyltransferase 20 [Acropora cervicornis]